MLRVFQVTPTLQVLSLTLITQEVGEAEMSPDATRTTAVETAGPLYPRQVSVYVVSPVSAEVVLLPVVRVPTDSFKNWPPERVQESAFPTPDHESIVVPP